jgi:uncharacterized protein
VLWLTDGPWYFELAVKAVNFDIKKHVPEMIVIAVGPPADGLKDFGPRRFYDFLPMNDRSFTGFGSDFHEKQWQVIQEQQKAANKPPLKGGGAAPFLSFLIDQLRPALARDYRMANDHVLFGDSAGGIFCVYALFARPDGFSKYICGSPVLNLGNHELFRMEERYAKEHGDLKAAVFLGAGEAEVLDPNEIISAGGIVSSTARMAEILRLRKYPSLQLSARIFPGEDHASVPPLNLSWGLRAVWKSDAKGLGKSPGD